MVQRAPITRALRGGRTIAGTTGPHYFQALHRSRFPALTDASRRIRWAWPGSEGAASSGTIPGFVLRFPDVAFALWELRMPRTGWTPSIVPQGDDQNVYLVVDDLGRNGRVWREADVETADLETVILDLLDGRYRNPIRVVAFNTIEGWSQDISADVAQELRRRCDLQMRDMPSSIQAFVRRRVA
jgi:hypothetical protein